jgi:hypothetical protein
MLHVWDGGVDEMKSLRDPAPSSIVLNVLGEDFARFWNQSLLFCAAGGFQSHRYLEHNHLLYSEGAVQASCNSNGIRLVFDRVPATPSSPAPLQFISSTVAAEFLRTPN